VMLITAESLDSEEVKALLQPPPQRT
jgi:hypothetical protein